MRKLLAFTISVYQRRLSPHKGFKCAHKGLHKGDSCSEFTKKKILDKGVFSSLKDIRQRFSDCREAAQTIQRSSLKYQRGDCDLGIGGCDSCDLGGKGSLPLDCYSGCDIFHSDRKNRKRDLWILASVILILILLAYYFVGRQVDLVDIRLKEGVEETSDRSLGKLFNTQLPDYKINFILDNGKTSTNTLRNTSAKSWISLKPKGSLYLSNIKEMTIVDKEITKSIKLESFSSPSKSGEGEKFEYTIRKKWDFF